MHARSSSWLDRMMGDDDYDYDNSPSSKPEKSSSSTTFNDGAGRMNFVVQTKPTGSLLQRSRSKSKQHRGASLTGPLEKTDSFGGASSAASSSRASSRSSSIKIGRTGRRSKSASSFNLAPFVSRSSRSNRRSSIDDSNGRSSRNDDNGQQQHNSGTNLSLNSVSHDTDDTAELSVGSASSHNKPSPDKGEHPPPSRLASVSSVEDDIILKMVEQHSLLDVPEDWLDKSTQLHQLCSSVDAWKAYSKFRKAVTKGAGYCPQFNDTDNDDILLQALQDQGNEMLERADKDLRNLSSKLSYPYPICIGAYMWPDNVHIRINNMDLTTDEKENKPTVDSLDMTAMIFSPLAVPRAIQLSHKYDRSKAGSDTEVAQASFDYRTISFQKGRKIKRGSWNKLLSVELNNDAIVSTNVDGLTLDAVSGMRGWLFGTANADDTTDACAKCEGATAFIDDYALLSLVFATAFVPLTPTPSYHSPLCQRSIGPTWPSNHMILDDDKTRISELQLKLGKTIRETSWLEYEVRRVTGRVRKQDEHFEL